MCGAFSDLDSHVNDVQLAVGDPVRGTNCWQFNFAKWYIWWINTHDVSLALHNFSKSLLCSLNRRSNATSAFLRPVWGNEATHWWTLDLGLPFTQPSYFCPWWAYVECVIEAHQPLTQGCISCLRSGSALVAGCQTLLPVFRPQLSLCAHSLAPSLYFWVRWHMQLLPVSLKKYSD